MPSGGLDSTPSTIAGLEIAQTGLAANTGGEGAACAEHPFRTRFPSGFVRPGRGGGSFWAARLKRPRCVHKCKDSGLFRPPPRPGTCTHRSHVPLKNWFRAMLLTVGHSNGISASQLKDQFGPGLQSRAASAAEAPPDETGVRFRLAAPAPNGRLPIACAAGVTPGGGVPGQA